MEFAVSDIHYFRDLQRRLGHSHKDDPKKLPLRKLVALGKALNEEYGLITGGQSNNEMKELILERIKERQDDGTYEEQRTFAWEKNLAVNNIGYHLSMGDAPATAEQRRELADEMWFLQRQLVDLAHEHDGDLQIMWLDFADQVARSAHYYENNDGAVAIWLSNLRTEFKRRQPRYVEPEVDDIEDAFANMDFDDMEEPEFTDDEIQIMYLEEQIHQRDQRYDMLNTLYKRLERIALGKEKASEEEILALRDAQYQLSADSFNAEEFSIRFRKNIELLEEMRPEGHSLTVSVRSHKDHFKRDLCLRYGLHLEYNQYTFHVKRLSHLNNYYGYFEGHEDTEVIIGLNINTKNKVNCKHPEMNEFDAKTALLPFSEGPAYLLLEREYAPGGVDFSRYTAPFFLEAHQKIKAGLDELRKKRASK